MQPFITLDAVAAPLELANVDTDQIIPARFLGRRRQEGMGDCLFHDLRLDASGHSKPEFVLNQPGYEHARIIVAGPNFGCGSSREHAVFALMDSGIRCVIAPSFGDIFFGNSVKNGLLPIAFQAREVGALWKSLRAQPGGRLTVNLPDQTVVGPDGFEANFDIDPFRKECLVKGLDELQLTLGHLEEIEAFERLQVQQ